MADTTCDGCDAVNGEQCDPACPERLAVRLFREPWPAGRLRTPLLRCENDERIVVRTEDGTAEYDVCGAVRWYEPMRQRWVTTLTVAPCDPEAEYVRLELAVEGS